MTKKKKSASGAATKKVSTTETGHAKNLANFETLIIDCQGFGTAYNPSNSAITITALQTIYTNATNALTDITLKNNTLSHTINAREVLFAPLKSLATQIMAALLASGANTETMLNAKTINRKIQGSRATKKIAASTTTPTTTPTGGGTTPTPTPTATTTPTPSPERTAPTTTTVVPHSISTAQLSYDNLVAHFQDLVNYVSLYSAYNPNEANLKVAALNTTAASFTTANNAVKTAQNALHTSMATRTTVLYNPTTGMINIAKEVKAYVKSAFGASSPQFKEINKIHFKEVVTGKPRKHHKKK
jgi:hypothetical protein